MRDFCLAHKFINEVTDAPLTSVGQKGMNMVFRHSFSKRRA